MIHICMHRFTSFWRAREKESDCIRGGDVSSSVCYGCRRWSSPREREKDRELCRISCLYMKIVLTTAKWSTRRCYFGREREWESQSRLAKREKKGFHNGRWIGIDNFHESGRSTTYSAAVARMYVRRPRVPTNCQITTLHTFRISAATPSHLHTHLLFPLLGPNNTSLYLYCISIPCAKHNNFWQRNRQ